MTHVCRSCGNADVSPILSLGLTPLANALVAPDQLDEPEETFPLDLVLCPRCTLVQITETVPADVLFRTYFYQSSFSDTVLENAKDIAGRMIADHVLDADSFVVEIASNDGYLLRNYVAQGIPVLGVEPAQNIARVAEAQGIRTICEFFDEALARRLQERGEAADVIHANNVVAHVADLHGVVAGIAALLKEDGVAVVENHYVKDLIDHVEFDSIYHEHLCYYSVTSFERLFRRHGLTLVDAERIPIHGGSLRVFFQRTDGPRSIEKRGDARVRQLLETEARWGVGDAAFYKGFGARVEQLRRDLVSLVRQLKASGKSIAVYGASAKSTTLLNYFRMGAETFDYVVDRSTVKQGRFTPGHAPVHSPAREAPRYSTRLRVAAHLEFRRRDPQTARRVPPSRGAVHHPHSETPSGVTDVQFHETKLEGAFVVEPERLEDERGFFARTWCSREFEARGLKSRLVQCSISFNQKKGTLRGMHYQVQPKAEVKLVRCTMGAIYDVIVDLRSESDTFAQWIAEKLTAENRRMLYIPEGFAHGFQTLVDHTEVFYQMSDDYYPEYARAVRWNDPAFGIEWPLPPTVISSRDRTHPDWDLHG